MQGDPGVTTFKHNGRDQIYVFVNGGGHLVVCFWNADPAITSWQWADLSQPPSLGIGGSPTAITSVQDDTATENFLHVFVAGSDGRLYEHFWNGVQWVDWVDHDRPAGDVPVNLRPGVVTFREFSGELGDAADRLFVFMWGDDEQLYRFLQKDESWLFQGKLPNQAHVFSDPAVIRLPPFSLYAYVVGNDGHLYVNFSADTLANTWKWYDLNQPDQDITVVGGIMRPGLVPFANSLQCFVRGSDGNLWACSWLSPQTPSQWKSLGMPANAHPVASAASVVTHTPEGAGVEFAYAFVKSDDSHLYVCRWDGGENLSWDDLGRPSTDGHDIIAQPAAGNTGVLSAPGAVTFMYPQPTTEQIYAFVLGADGHLHVCYGSGGDGDPWHWNDLRTPSAAEAGSFA